mmetsp:Transcript_34986/g.64791  ORF Transcript_34986/g.64791 Transcript_34986/m.64791 type:complete len:540 (-) Transcript_34986:383-2002(-)
MSAETKAQASSPQPEYAHRARLFGLSVDPNELASTEKIYLDRLMSLLTLYHDPLKKMVGTKKEILKEDELRRVFNIIPLLVQYHTKLHTDLKAATTAERPKAATAHVLVKHAPYLRMYKDYVTNVKGALDFVTTCKSKKFKEFVSTQEKEAGSKSMSLPSLLLLPVHRLPQYRDLMQSLMENTEKKDDDYAVIKSAADICTEVTSQINQALRQYEEQLQKFQDENPTVKATRKDKSNALLTVKERKTTNKDFIPSPSRLVRGKSVEREFSRSGNEVKTKTDVFVEQFCSTWQSARNVVYKDLPRLVRRIKVHTPKGVLFEGSDESRGLWESICSVITVVATTMETKETLTKLTRALKAQDVKDNAEIFPSLKSVFEDTLGLNSKTMKVFKTVHQSILVPAMVKLADTVFKPLQQNFKDVKRPEGWQVQIHLGEAVYVIHTRIEQSLHSREDPQHFECEWALRLSFDKNMDDLRAVCLHGPQHNTTQHNTTQHNTTQRSAAQHSTTQYTHPPFHAQEQPLPCSAMYVGGGGSYVSRVRFV